MIIIDALENTINLLVPQEELNERKLSWKAPELRERSGSLYKYAKMVSSASEGCVTDAF
jgi:dihydroxy-acid dehydratase